MKGSIGLVATVAFIASLTFAPASSAQMGMPFYIQPARDTSIKATVYGTNTVLLNCGYYGNQCNAGIKPGTTVSFELQLPPEKYLEFDHWTGACAGQPQQCTVRIEEQKTVAAVVRPIPRSTLTISPVPANGVIRSKGGLECGASRPKGVCSIMLRTGTSITLTEETEGRNKRTWTGACSAATTATCEVKLASDISAGATYERIKQYIVRVHVPWDLDIRYRNGERCHSPTCEFESALGKTETMYAHVPPFTFWPGPVWSGDCTGQKTGCNVTISKELTEVSARRKQ